MLEMSLIVYNEGSVLRAKISPDRVRFIKLGTSGAWAKEAIEEDVVYFGAYGVSHTDCLAESWQNVRNQLKKVTTGPQNQSEGLRQIKEFYDPKETLWVTLVDGHIWWAISSGEPETISEMEADGPSHFRRCQDSWSDQDVDGNTLVARNISSRLTKTSALWSTLTK